ncbi:hypothetical protein BDN72DRAFT_890280 [Pluteus cervinus]|uniref:Uncharacterized protein n=1 Tax=Pluteus cervinus TaxID=181527 RepID=A0ACD3A4R4_9AGAR|nr:hypothetical protein BDN72DRAFT_890280 [Pluteus cervinus]
MLAKYTLLFLSLSASVYALATPHEARGHHHALAARLGQTPANAIMRRKLSKRCQPRAVHSIGLGACGVYNSGSDHIAAVSKLMFDTFPGYDGTNPNNNPVCGRSITATHNGQSTVVVVTDRCEACAITDLDFSPAAYDEIASEVDGRVQITWVWN